MIICNRPIPLAERGLNVADIIGGIDINKTTLHKLYKDDLIRIDFDTIDRISDLLGIPVEALFIYK